MPSLPPDSPDSPPTERCARYQVATHAGRTPSLPESGARSGPLERFGLFAGDAAGGELLGDGEHVEHEGQPTHAAGAENRLAAAQSIPRDFGAKARWRNGRFRPQTIGNIDRFRLTVHPLSDAALVLQVLGRGLHLVSVPRLPVVGFGQPRHPGVPAGGDQLDRAMLRAVLVAQDAVA